MALTSGQMEIARRREENSIVIDDRSVCYFCNSTGLADSDRFCPNCAFPQGGEQHEMRQFIRLAFDKQKIFEKKKKAVKHGRNLLYILSGLNLLLGVVLGLVVQSDPNLLIGGIILAAVYLGLGRWSERQPFAAILSAFFVFVITNVIGAIANPNSIAQGFLLKGIILSGFVYGFKGVKDAGKLGEELKTMNTAKDLKTPE